MHDLAVKGARPDPNSVILARLSCLIDYLLPNGSPERTVFELGFEQLMKTNFDEMLSQVNRADILQGLPNRKAASKLIVPG